MESIKNSHGCVICGFDKNIVLFGKKCGYIKGTEYDIFQCNDCNTQFIDPQKIEKKIYDLIYSEKSQYLYSRYIDYSTEILKKQDPLDWLARQEMSYYSIKKFLDTNKKKLKILEAGCGRGYLTYSIHKLGHDIKGIDISKNAIKYALANYGKYYECIDIEKFKTTEKYDLIILTEVIEHLENVDLFIKQCSNLLSDNGKILITTPNKDSYKNQLWKTDLPPVHISWLSKKSFDVISMKNNMAVEYIDCSGYFENHENRLLRLFHYNKQSPLIDENGKLNKIYLSNKNSTFKDLIKGIIYSKPIIFICNNIEKIIRKELPTLTVVLSKI